MIKSCISFIHSTPEGGFNKLISISDQFRESEATKDFSIIINLNEIREVHLCRYNLRRSALEIFLIDHRNFLFNFPGKVTNNGLKSCQNFEENIDNDLPYLGIYFSCETKFMHV